MHTQREHHGAAVAHALRAQYTQMLLVTLCFYWPMVGFTVTLPADFVGVRGSPERGYFFPVCVWSGRWADLGVVCVSARAPFGVVAGK